MLGDNSMILGHKLSQLCGHGPTLETDIALTNISLDFFGQVRSYFQYAAELKGDGATEDTIAYKRYEREHFNVILVEQPNTDFAHVITRQFLFDAYHHLLLKQLVDSKDVRINAIAQKSIKESKYHLRFSSEWMKRLGAGTELSHQKLQSALDVLYPFAHELFQETEVEKEMKEKGIGADLTTMRADYDKIVATTLLEAEVKMPEIPNRQTNGKTGIHSEQLGFIIAEFQYMQRAYPNMTW